MKLEELTDQELNKRLHKLAGLCVHKAYLYKCPKKGCVYKWSAYRPPEGNVHFICGIHGGDLELEEIIEGSVDYCGSCGQTIPDK